MNIRLPPIRRETYKTFKNGVEKRNNGQSYGNLPEEIEKALIFYEIAGREVHHTSFDELREYLQGVTLRMVVDVDGSAKLDLNKEFVLAFGDIYRIRKKALMGFIEYWTGHDGNYTYRKYSKQFRESGLMEYDYKIKVFRTTRECREEFRKMMPSKVPKSKIEAATKEAKEILGRH